ncbi:MAG: aminotransferase class I/II-fold pyridoxal phosphate-dependent enzyme [Anaerolineaceae bacterium]|nr:aminotransferase class I/II-fold pyridoxal phosphate-dependent enzyme [Anaerolineaceae bacterium]
MQSSQTAKRTDQFQESVIREMTRLGEITNSINLSQGLPEMDPPPQILQAASQAILDGENQYTFPFGLADFRLALAEKYARYNQIQCDPELEITVTCGVSEAMISTILALTDPGDEVLIFEPWYENYIPDCIMAGVTPRFYRLQEADFSIDFVALEKIITPKTRLLILNTPHNPSGKVFSKNELTQIANLCIQHNLIAVTDEIYEHILYDQAQHISLGSLPGMQERTVTISGLGKTYAVTGWRVGWAVAHTSLTALIRKVHDYLTVCAPAPFQKAGITALQLPDSYYEEMQAAYAGSRSILMDALSQAGFSAFAPQGAYYVMADFRNISWPENQYSQPHWTRDRAFAEFLAREVGVAVVPGSSFYNNKQDGENLVRFNFAKKKATLAEAAQRLVKYDY